VRSNGNGDSVPFRWAPVGVNPTLLSHNKLVTVDNLKKKGLSKPEHCCFCSEKDSINHLLFECVIAKNVWEYVKDFLGFDIGSDYISVASRWLHKEKYYVANTISTVVLRSICLIINYFIFNRSDVKLIL
jgi:hypothetical protein